jgi:hypothetical protein
MLVKEFSGKAEKPSKPKKAKKANAASREALTVVMRSLKAELGSADPWVREAAREALHV